MFLRVLAWLVDGQVNNSPEEGVIVPDSTIAHTRIRHINHVKCQPLHLHGTTKGSCSSHQFVLECRTIFLSTADNSRPLKRPTTLFWEEIMVLRARSLTRRDCNYVRSQCLYLSVCIKCHKCYGLARQLKCHLSLALWATTF